MSARIERLIHTVSNLVLICIFLTIIPTRPGVTNVHRSLFPVISRGSTVVNLSTGACLGFYKYVKLLTPLSLSPSLLCSTYVYFNVSLKKQQAVRVLR